MGHNDSQTTADVKRQRATGSASRAPSGRPPTREQIMLVASNLFATQGYHGTTTREIAQAVGIRQPSLFHHFESKAAIMVALLEEDLGPTIADRERLARADEPAGVRLYRYIHREVRHIAHSRYNVAGIYSEEVRTSAELERWYARRRRLHRAINRIVHDGKVTGEFVDIDSDVIRASILGTLQRALVGYSAGQASFDPTLAQQIARLLLRSVLVDPDRLDAIQETVLSTEPVSRRGSGTTTDPGDPPHERLVSDRAWQSVSAVLPPRVNVRGGQWRDDRQIFEAIAWRTITGSSWRDLPPRFGPWQTAWKRHDRWLRDGTWARMRKAGAVDPATETELSWMV